MSEARFRNKITWFSFVFSLLVVWIHAYNAELFLGRTARMEAVFRAEHLIGELAGQIAVPGFFMISGYLFYRNFTWEKLMEKWNRRIKSVLVPYILWNFLYYMGYVAGSRLPWMREVVGKGVVPFHLAAAVDAVINYTYNYVFWYLYQLILLILLAPVLYAFLRRRLSGCLFLAAVWGIVLAEIAGMDLPFLNGDALLYYSCAGFLAIHGRRFVEGSGRPDSDGTCEKADSDGTCEGSDSDGACEGAQIPRGRMVLGIAVLLAAAAAYRTGVRVAHPVFFVVCRMAAVAGLWILVPAEKLPEAGEVISHNFFLYAVHFAFVRFINKAGAKLLPAYPAVPVILYLAMPFLILGISTVLGKCLRSLMPGMWRLLNGGR